MLVVTAAVTVFLTLPIYAKKDKNLDLSDTGLEERSDKVAVLFVPGSAPARREKVSWRHSSKTWKVVFTASAPPCPEVAGNAISGRAGERKACTPAPVTTCPTSPAPFVTADNKRYCRYPYVIEIGGQQVSDPEIVIEEDGIL